jgi:nitrite reductase (NADH) large subunit
VFHACDCTFFARVSQDDEELFAAVAADDVLAAKRGLQECTELTEDGVTCVTGIDLFSAGDFLGGPGSEALVMRDAKRGIYKRIVIEDNKLRGAVLYGDTRDGAWYCDLMNEGRDIGALRDKLIFGEAVASRP